MRKFKSLLTAAVTALPFLAGIAAPMAAHAQSIDYGSLESLFGEPVTTSATGSPQRSTEVPVDMTIISAEDIKRSGAKDLPTLLGRVPGLDVLSWSAEGSDVGVRGYDQPMSPRLLVLVNGRQVYLDHYGYTAWSTIPVQLSEIRQIEVVKGPNSALFGFNAVSGVVNIITYNPKYDTVNSATVRAATDNGKSASVVQTLRFGPKFAARFSMGANKQDEWDNTASLGATAYRASPSQVNANIDAVASLSDKTELRFESSLSNSQVTDMISTYGYYATKYLTSSTKLDLTSETGLGLIQATAYRNTMASKEFLVTTNAAFRNTITDFSVQDLFKVGAKHTFRIGLEQRHNTLATTPVTGGEVSYDVTAVSGMWNWAVSDAFSIAAAVRSDTLALKRTGTFPAGYPIANNSNWDRDIGETSYNAGAVWRVSGKDTLRAMIAKGVQLPTLVELGGLELNVPGPGYTIAYMGNPFLKVSVIKNQELSYDHSFAHARLGLRVFAQTTTNLKGQPSGSELFQAPTMTTFPAVSWDNVANSKMSGFEVSASGTLSGGYRWSGDYTTTDVKDTAIGTHNVTGRKAAYGHTTPKARGNVSLGWADTKWSVDGYLHYTSDFEQYALAGGALMPIKAYTTLAANVGYNLGHNMSLSLSGQNLFNARQVQTDGLKVPPTIFLSLRKSW